MKAAIAILYLLALAPSAPPAGERFPLPCTYVAHTIGAELEPHAECARRKGERLVFSVQTLRAVSYDEHRLAQIAVEYTWHYLKRNGDSLPVMTYDNGADEFSEGLVRSVIGGKIVYFNRAFRQVVAPRYDWGWPFKNGRALVCSGCKEEQAGEHVNVVGGAWGYIDHAGKEVVPVTLDQDQAAAMEMNRQ